MAKAKSKAAIMVADGAGGMVKVLDRRFESAGWPVQLGVPKEQAGSWLRFLNAECQKRGWSSSGITQLEARENSGSLTFRSADDASQSLEVVWELKRAGSLKISARFVGGRAPEPSTIDQLFGVVTERCRLKIVETFYRRGVLEYVGLPWRGELWLDDTSRLGPPSLQYEDALLGPRAIIVDTIVGCPGPNDLPGVFRRTLEELGAFLSVVLGTYIHPPYPEKRWTWTFGDKTCQVRNVEYFEPEAPREMPDRGTYPDVPLRPVERPDLSEPGILAGDSERDAPSDVHDLWLAYRDLNAEQRQSFLQAAAKWQESLAHWGKRDTLSFALMVVACEALKPPSPEYRDNNADHIIEALLGSSWAQRARGLVRGGPQGVRKGHLHRGEFWGSEFSLTSLRSTFEDPTFMSASREFAKLTRATLIEWLRRRGIYSMAPARRR